MIRSIQIEGFKCFNDNVFDLKSLNILSGKNASGKTSFLQAIALLHQTICERGNFEQLVLNGAVVHLGRADDVLNKTKAKNSLYFKVETSTGATWAREYTVENRNEFIFVNKPEPRGIGGEKEVLDLFRILTYLSAERLGPRETHSLDNSAIYTDVGVGGERAISKLLANDLYEVPDQLCIANVSPKLQKQVEAHMQNIFPGFRFDTQAIRGTNNAILSLAINDEIGFVRPQNIGFGLSYTLPIFIACLSARAGSIILIENPEAHLHPSAQSQMGEFLAKVAACGVQLIVETHSDHVLNGIRRSVKQQEHPIKPEDVQLFFFSGMNRESLPNIISPVIASNGELSEWPQDFFDQYEKDLSALVDW